MPLKLKETNISNEHNRLKNPNWREADQLVIYKHDRGVELGSTKKQLQLSGQSGTRTRDLRISSPAPLPLGHAASSIRIQGCICRNMEGHAVSFDSVPRDAQTVNLSRNVSKFYAGQVVSLINEQPSQNLLLKVDSLSTIRNNNITANLKKKHPSKGL